MILGIAMNTQFQDVDLKYIKNFFIPDTVGMEFFKLRNKGGNFN